MVFLGLCIFVISGITFEYMCDFIVEWARLCFGIGCLIVYICVLSSVFVYFIVFCAFVLLLWLFSSE